MLAINKKSRTLPLWGNISARAAGKRAFRRLCLKCEPYSATTLQSKVESYLIVHYAKKPPKGWLCVVDHQGLEPWTDRL